jgi:hypothetical protein
MLRGVFEFADISRMILNYEVMFPSNTSQLLLYFPELIPEFQASSDSYDRLMSKLR